MPSNRGAHPEDPEQFGSSEWSRLRAAVRDLSWLRSRGYGGSATRKLVGDRYNLKRRQRNAVARSSCSDAERAHRLAARLSPGEGRGRQVDVDAFNALITVEAALGGAYLFVGRDSAYRDVNPLQGTYRIVRQTDSAIEVLAETLRALDLGKVAWYLDRSVSNVGRVKARLRAAAPDAEGAWEFVERDDVDGALCESPHPVVTSDSAILDATDAWLPLEAFVHARHLPEPNLVDLRPDGERSALPGS